MMTPNQIREAKMCLIRARINNNPTEFIRILLVLVANGAMSLQFVQSPNPKPTPKPTPINNKASAAPAA